MGIDHLNLSSALISALYPESLVAGKETDSTEKTGKIRRPPGNPDPAYPSMGRNLRSVCFLVHYPENEFIPEIQLDFLRKILAACKYSLDDIALINTGRIHLDYGELKKQFKPSVIFLWGNVPAMPGYENRWKDMEIFKWENISVLPVLQADLMSSDNPAGQTAKRTLWISLKKLFSL